MKKTVASFVMLIVTVVALSLYACSKGPEDLLVGRWGVVRATTMSEGMTFDNTEYLKGLTLEFGEDGRVVVAEPGMSASGRWVYSDGSITIEIDGEEELFVVDNLEKSAMTLSVTEVEDHIESTIVMDFEKL